VVHLKIRHLVTALTPLTVATQYLLPQSTTRGCPAGREGLCGNLADRSHFSEKLGPSYLVHRTPRLLENVKTCRTNSSPPPGFVYSKLMLTASALRTSMEDGRTEIPSKGETPISR
jgi:hypothetical protein